MGRPKGSLNKSHKPLKISKCKQCGMAISDKLSINRTFCSIACKASYQKEYQKGSNNPNWKESKQFRSSIPHKLRKLAIARDGSCNDCGGIKNLQVHHHDINAYNNDLNNLITLCKNCHAKRHEILGDYVKAKLIMSERFYNHAPPRPCAACGKIFTPRDKRIRCCSRKCAYKLSGQTHQGKPAWNKGINDIELTCLVCGIVFKRSKGRLDCREGVLHFCSKQCQIRYAVNCRLTKARWSAREQATP